jgi:hypothetical protein
MAEQSEFEFVFEPRDEGGYHVYAPDLPGLHTQGKDIDEATENAQEALALTSRVCAKKVGPVGSGIVRRRLAVRRVACSISLSVCRLIGFDAGLAVKQVGSFVRGQGNPTYTTLVRLCEGLHVSPGELTSRADHLYKSVSGTCD